MLLKYHFKYLQYIFYNYSISNNTIIKLLIIIILSIYNDHNHFYGNFKKPI